VVAQKKWELGGGAECAGAALLKGVEWSVVPVTARDAEGEGMMGQFDGILLEPTGAKEAAQKSGPKLPLIAYPHGGPHSNMGCEYYASIAVLVLQGYAVLLINYRGSTGYGQGLVESLHGKVGRQDVDDVKDAIDEVLKTRTYLDGGRVGVCGGSHGGFLSLHLVGQYPELFKSTAVRNPVTNIATMYGATDIPDWCYTETGSPFAYAQVDFCFPQKSALYSFHVQKILCIDVGEILTGVRAAHSGAICAGSVYVAHGPCV
jgi:dipeptidyl aminopeptidase/acylaminoacyl peptidase